MLTNPKPTPDCRPINNPSTSAGLHATPDTDAATREESASRPDTGVVKTPEIGEQESRPAGGATPSVSPDAGSPVAADDMDAPLKDTPEITKDPAEKCAEAARPPEAQAPIIMPQRLPGDRMLVPDVGVPKSKWNFSIVQRELVTIANMEAKYGMVFVTDKDGVTYTMTPQDAAQRLLVLSHSIPDEPLIRTKVLDFMQRALTVVRKARYQQEAPTDRPTEILKPLLDQYQQPAAAVPDKLQDLVRSLKIKMPMLDEDEILQVLTGPLFSSKSQSWREGMLKVLHEERMRLWQTEHRMMPPI